MCSELKKKQLPVTEVLYECKNTCVSPSLLWTVIGSRRHIFYCICYIITSIHPGTTSPLTLSSLSLPLSSSSTTSRELLSQFSTCSG